jgi:hypothetical protein
MFFTIHHNQVRKSADVRLEYHNYATATHTCHADQHLFTDTDFYARIFSNGSNATSAVD